MGVRLRGGMGMIIELGSFLEYGGVSAEKRIVHTT